MKRQNIEEAATGTDRNSETTSIPIRECLLAGDVRQWLRIGKDKLADLISDGELPVVMFGTRRRHFDPADVAKLIQEKKLLREKGLRNG